MFTFTPLLGARSESRASQSLLELDGGVKILVDVGWDETFDTRQLAEIEKHASTLSFILLTHATTSHLGAFAHCCKHIPNFSHIPVYATSPVIAFGRTLLQDLYSSSPLASTFISNTVATEDVHTTDAARTTILRQPPSATEITKFFSLITPLKYSQPHQPTASQFSAPLEGLVLTAYNSGHTLGGTIWHIQHGMESIVYAVDWNQTRENVIAGAAWFGGVGGSEVIEQLRKPTALVCSSTGAGEIAPPGGRKVRDDRLLSHIRSSVSKGGTVLIPTDSSARVLELAWILEKAWQESGQESSLRKAKIYLASKSAHATLRHARSLVEWMDDSIVREFEGDDEAATRTHKRSGSRQTNGAAKPSRPFEFKHIKLVERQAQFEKALASEGPSVILASDLSLDWGFSQPALLEIAQKPENLIILTDRVSSSKGESSTEKTSPYSTLWQWYTEREDGVALEKPEDGEQVEQIHSGGKSVTVRIIQREALDPVETQVYQQYMATRRQLETSLVTSNDTAVDVADDALDDDSSSSSSDESDEEHQGRALNVSTALGHASRNKVMLNDEDLGVSILLRKKGIYDFDVRDKKGRNAVFPYTHSRRRGDDFGDYIRPEDFLRPEEKEDQDGQSDLNLGTSATGQKRKWDDLRQTRDNANKRQQVRQGERKVDASRSKLDDAEDDSDSEESGGEEETEVDDVAGPTKAVVSETNLAVNARLAFVDFAGIHDQRSLQMIIPLIGPKRLILTHGTAAETNSLASDCRGLLSLQEEEGDNKVSALLTPSIGQTVDASVDTNAWIVKLGRDLVRRLQWQSVRNMDVVTLSGQLRGNESRSEHVLVERTKKPRLVKESSVAAAKEIESAAATKAVEPLLDVVPTSIAASTRSVAQPIHVGDMRLADLRRLMNVAGHGAEFRGEGTLVIDGIVAVRKLGTGKIVVEGASVGAVSGVSQLSRSDSFTQVKRKIYEGLAVVAAG